LQSTALALNSTLDFEAVLDSILTYLEHVMPYDLADVMMVEGDLLRVVRHRGYTEHGLGAIIASLQVPFRHIDTFQTMEQTGKPFYIPDTSVHPTWESLVSGKDWQRAYLGAPLFVNDRLVGFLNVNSKTADAYTEADARRLEVFASQVSMAISNAQLHDTVIRHSVELEQRIRDLIVVYELGHALSSTLKLPEIYALLYYEVAQALFDAPHMRVALLNPETGSIHYDFAIADGEVLDAHTLPLDDEESACLQKVVDTRRTFTRGSSVYEPLISKNRVLGVLQITHHTAYDFDEVDVTLLSTVANLAAVALENAQLYAMVESQREELRQYTADLEKRVAARTAELRDSLHQERLLNELKTRFVMTVSHQFRTPLTAIQSAKEMLKHYGDRMTPEQRSQRYEMLDHAVMDIVRLIEDSIMMNRLAGHEFTLRPDWLDLNLLTKDIINEFSNRAGKTHRIVYASDSQESFNLVDSDMWRKVVSELLVNAAKFSAPGSTIDTHLSSASGVFTFSVSDEGMGIAPDDLERIFGIFDRGVNVENIPGGGLGLAIVKQSIERHGGTVTVTSTLGRGTTVTLQLPKYVLEAIP
jgi:K+-sensing histidine kinase KdpD